MMAQAFKWDGESMAPLRPKLADETYVIGEVYWLEVEQQRSEMSHRHEFAWLREAWKNLPENLHDQFPTPEALRKKALIDGGFFNETMIDAGSQAAALRVASYVRAKQEFAHVVTRGPLVVVREAKSQSRRAMDKDEFQRSKTAVLEIVAGVIGVAPDTLKREAGMAA